MDVLRKLRFGLTMVLAIIIPIAVLTVAPWWLPVALLVLLAAWIGVSRSGRQMASVAMIGIASIPKRFGASCVVVVGIASVVGVFVALLAMGAGFEAMLRNTGTDDTVLVMSRGAQTEMDSTLDHETALLVSEAPQVLRNAQGKPIASAELVMTTPLSKAGDGRHASVEVRGVGPRVWEVRTNVKLIAGRKFVPGVRELLVGNRVLRQFTGVAIGSTLNISGQSWAVVGVFDSGDALSSEIWGDTAALASAYRRGAGESSLVLRLTSASAFDGFKATLATDTPLKVEVQTTRQYYYRQSHDLADLIRTLGIVVCSIMAMGAIFGALNTMYAAVSTRAREIATMRAIGFEGAPVVGSVLLEAMFLATVGGAIGAGVAWLVFDGFTASTMGANFGQVVFAFDVSSPLIWNGVKWALAIGLIGGIFPAIRAARLSVAASLREL